MAELLRRRAVVGDLEMHWLEQGKGPLVLLCHGFPECSWSWRHQIAALAGAGMRVVAPDLRGYGGTRGPATPETCDVVSLTSDLVTLVAALGERRALLVGHDFGALLAWHAATLRADVFRAVACLSVGYPTFLTGSRPPLTVLRERVGDAFHYILYFQEPGTAEAELEADIPKALAAILGAGETEQTFLPSTRTRFLEGLRSPAQLPAWIGPDDFDVYVRAFQASGFAGPLAWYRAFDRGWQRLGSARSARVTVPAMFMVGSQDPVLSSTSGLLARMRERVPNLEDSIVLDGCGHWIQQERPQEVSEALVAFARRHA